MNVKLSDLFTVVGILFDVPWTLNRRGAAYEDPHASIAPRRTVQCVKNARGANRTFDVARAYNAEMARTHPA